MEIGRSNAAPTDTAREKVHNHRLEQTIQREIFKTAFNGPIY
jgi:hypothetical protein